MAEMEIPETAFPIGAYEQHGNRIAGRLCLFKKLSEGHALPARIAHRGTADRVARTFKYSFQFCRR